MSVPYNHHSNALDSTALALSETKELNNDLNFEKPLPGFVSHELVSPETVTTHFDRRKSQNLLQSDFLSHAPWELRYHMALLLKELKQSSGIVPVSETIIQEILNLAHQDKTVVKKTFKQLSAVIKDNSVPATENSLLVKRCIAYALHLAYRFGLGVKSKIDFQKVTRHVVYSPNISMTFDLLNWAEKRNSAFASATMGDWLCQAARYAPNNPIIHDTVKERFYTECYRLCTSEDKLRKLSPDIERSHGIGYIKDSARGGNSYGEFLYGFYLVHGYHISHEDENPKINFCFKAHIKNEPDPKTAFLSFRSSSEKGDPHGQTMLGYCFEHGIGTKQDFNMALVEYSLACAQGAPFAKYRLARLYEQLGLEKLSIQIYQKLQQEEFRVMLPVEFRRSPHECSTDLVKEQLQKRLNDPVMPILFSYFGHAYPGLAYIVKEYVGVEDCLSASTTTLSKSKKK